ncbi:unnamed protein product [Sphagnum balticum]
MPNFNKESAGRGNEVVERGNQNTGTYRPFLPKIYWKEADDHRFILVLNPLEDIVRLKFHPFLETDDGTRTIIARTDPGIGERTDPIEQQWGYVPRTTDIMIAVELEPVYETKTVGKHTRESITAFSVVLKTIERRVRDEDGDLTDEKEDFEVPAVGWIAQSPFNFGNLLNAYENNDNPIHITPFKVTQVGSGSDTKYSFDGYPDAPIDLTNLLEYIENVSFIQNPDELLGLIEGLDQEEAGIVIGQYLLDLKLEELADADYYDEIFKSISKPSRYGPKEKKDTTRPKRVTQRPLRSAASSDEVKPNRTSAEKVPSARAKLEELKAIQAAKAAEAVAA